MPQQQESVITNEMRAAIGKGEPAASGRWT
jgi:hypothetical protein